MRFPRPASLLLGLLSSLPSLLTAAKITVDPEHPAAAISPTLWGCFFEDINFGADGGLYAELVKNRGFEFPDAMTGWSVIKPSLASGSASLQQGDSFIAENPHYLRLTSKGTALFGLSNEGFRGMGLKAGDPYRFTARVRLREGHPKLLVRLYGQDGAILAEQSPDLVSTSWTQVTCTLAPNDTDDRSRLTVLLDGAGSVDVDFVSLFPEKTWKGRAGGLRADLVQALADLKPGFFRFPGGCIVEGRELATRYPWKQTLAPVEQRPTIFSRWSADILHRPTPDYQQSLGLGFFEYFQLCEDIGAQPVPVVNCGMACQFNSCELCPPEELHTYIQDALDLIEFANGPVDSPWGAKRAQMGHPAPFGLKFLGIGNEQWGPAYIERFAQFSRELKARHPEIRLIGAAGAFPEDEFHKLAWEKLPGLNADIIDEHAYAKPDWFLANTHRYDRRDRKGPKVMMGEFAAQSVQTVSPKNENNLECALSEAAFMTGLERNADLVEMAAYAPLLAHKDAWQWTPNLLWFDNLNILRTPSYHVQRLFSLNRGDRVLPVSITLDAGEAGERLAASAAWDSADASIIIKCVNAEGTERPLHLQIKGGRSFQQGTLTVLAASAKTVKNTFVKPAEVEPHELPYSTRGKSAVDLVLPANSLSILRLHETTPAAMK